LDLPPNPVAIGSLFTDEHNCHGRSLQLFPNALPDIVLVGALDRVEKMSSQELDVDVLVPAKKVESLRLHLVVVLVRNEHPASHRYPRHNVSVRQSRALG